MDRSPLSSTLSGELAELMSELDTEYYHPIEALCGSAGRRVEQFLESGTDASLALYIGLCSDLIRRVEDYLKLRNMVLLPYLRDLALKETEGHDCRSCTGNCSAGHAARLAELQIAHAQIKGCLKELQHTQPPPYTGARKGDFRLLRNEIMLLDAALEEVFDTEDSRLLPRITAAQIKIHA